MMAEPEDKTTADRYSGDAELEVYRTLIGQFSTWWVPPPECD